MVHWPDSIPIVQMGTEPQNGRVCPEVTGKVQEGPLRTSKELRTTRPVGVKL